MKKFVLFTFMLFSVVFGHSQKFDIGLHLGGMMYSGDLDPGGFFDNLQNTEFTYGAHLRYALNKKFALRFQFENGSISSADRLSDENSRKLRNLSFESGIQEFSFFIENNIFGFDVGSFDYDFSPYLFIGVSVYKFNPRALYQGQLVELQPLGTEGQGMANFDQRYSLTQISIPMGGGLKYKINNRFSVAVEGNVRFTFTDYLDDVSGTYVSYEELIAGNGQLSANLAHRTGELTGDTTPYTADTGAQRGNPDIRDYYMSAKIVFSYHFDAGGIMGRSNDVGCPTF